MRVSKNFKTVTTVMFVLALCSCMVFKTSAQGIVNNSTGYFQKLVAGETITVQDPDNSVWTSVAAVAGSTVQCQVGASSPYTYYEISKQSDKVFITLDESYKPAADFLLTIRFNVKLYDQAGTLFDQRLNQNITLNYQKDKPYDHTAQLVLENTRCMNRMEVTIVQVFLTGDVSLNHVICGAQVNKSKIMYMPSDPAQTVITGVTNSYNATDNSLDLVWNVAPWASSYEVQWIWIDTYDPYLSGAKKITEELMKSGTKVITNNANYSIPLLYDKGYILYRIRGSGRPRNTAVSPDIDIAGVWSDYGTSFPVDVAAYPNRYNHTAPHALGLNWQSTMSFAEEGKKMVAASYSDGISRSRQSVSQVELSGLTNMKSTIVSETVYDAEGRPAATILPAPSLIRDIRFMPGFNLSDADPTKNFSSVDFDKEHVSDNCKNTLGGLSTSSGASKYYSPSNGLLTDPVLGRMYSAVPDAQKYPYTLTVFTDDNSGRPREQSGVGADFKAGGDRTTRYFYGKPFQEELDRLFGSDVGYATNYKRNMVRDANGQYSISYLDLKGRVIATSLQGNKPDNVNKPSTYRTDDQPMNIDLLNKIRKTDKHGVDDRLFLADGKRVLNSQFTIAQTGTREFYYKLENNFYTPPCLPTGAAVPAVSNTHVTNSSFNISTTNLYPGTPPNGVLDVQFSDIDYDLDMDMVLTYSDRIVILQNNVVSPVLVASHFRMFEIKVSATLTAKSVLIADLDIDQMPELIVSSGNSFMIYKNMSNSQFPVFEAFVSKSITTGYTIKGMVSTGPNGSGKNVLVALVSTGAAYNLYSYEIDPALNREGLYYMNTPTVTSLSVSGTPDRIWFENVHSNVGTEVIVSTTSSAAYIYTTVLAPLTSTTFPGLATGSSTELSFADIDGDKNTDIVAYKNGIADVYGITYTNLGTGSPAAVKTFASNVSDLVLHDFNKDGKADVIAITGSNLSFIENTSASAGSISYGSVTQQATGSSLIRAGDLNEDGRMDFVHVTSTGNIFYANNVISANPACYECVLDLDVSLKSKACGDEYLSDLVNVSGTDRNYTTIGPLTTITTNPDFFPMNACGAQPTVFKRGNPVACTGCVTGGVCDENAASCSWMGNRGLNIKDGEYIISRTLKVNERALQIYTDNYVKNNDCLKTLKDFEKEAFDQIDFSQCDITCEERYRRLGSEYAYSLYNETFNSNCARQYGCLTQTEYDKKREEYETECGSQQTGCESYYVQLIGDMSPGGQYGKTRPTPSINEKGDIEELEIVAEADPSVFPLSIFNENNQLPQRAWIHTEIENYHTAASIPMLSYSWVPGWRYPMNMNGTVGSELRHSYVDEAGQIDYVVLAFENNKYVPAVHPSYISQVVYDGTLKRYKVKPQYLNYVKDFLANWKESWAISLIVYHPEYGYLDQCVRRAASNRWDDAWFAVDNVSYTYMPDGSYVEGANQKFPFWYAPIVTSNFSDFKTAATTLIRDNFQDPYFSAANAGNLLPGEFDAFLSKLYMLTMKGSQFKNIWEVTYAAVNCSDDCPCNYSNTYLTTDKEWRMFRGLYQSLKQEAIKRHDILVSIRDGFYNGCISTEPFDINKNLFDKAYYQQPFASTLFDALPWVYNANWSYWFFHKTGFFNFAHTQQYNFEQPCNAARSHLYKGKHARFYPEMTNNEKQSSEVCSISDFSAFEIPFCEEKVNAIIAEIKGKNLDKIQRECKQCDFAFYFSEFINQIIEDDAYISSLRTNGSYLENISLCGQNRSATVFSNMEQIFTDFAKRQNPSVSIFTLNYYSTIDLVNGIWTHTISSSSMPIVNLTMNLPAGFKLGDLKRVCCIRGIDNPTTTGYEFEMDVQMKMRPGDADYNGVMENIPGFNGMPNVSTVKITGKTDELTLVVCERDRYCVKTDLAVTLQSFLNGLVYKEPKLFFSTTTPPAPYTLPWTSFGGFKNLILSKCQDDMYDPTPLAGRYNAELFEAFRLMNFGDFIGDDVILSMDESNPGRLIFYIHNIDASLVPVAGYDDTLRKFYCSFTVDLGGVTLNDISRFSGVTGKDGAITMYGFTTGGSRVNVSMGSSCIDLVKCYNELDDEAHKGAVATFEEIRRYKLPVTKCRGLNDQPVIPNQDIEVTEGQIDCSPNLFDINPVLNPQRSMAHILALFKSKLSPSNAGRPTEGMYRFDFIKFGDGATCIDCDFKIISQIDLSTLTPDTIVGIGREWGSKTVHNIYVRTKDGPKPLIQVYQTSSCRNVPRYKNPEGGSPVYIACQPLCPVTPISGSYFGRDYEKVKTMFDDVVFPFPWREFTPDSNEFILWYDPDMRGFNTEFTGDPKVRLHSVINRPDSVKLALEYEIGVGEYCIYKVLPLHPPKDCYFDAVSLVFRLENYYTDPAYKQVWQKSGITVQPNTEYTFRFTLRDLFLNDVNERFFAHPIVTINGITPSVALKHDEDTWVYEYYWRSGSSTTASIEIKVAPSVNSISSYRFYGLSSINFFADCKARACCPPVMPKVMLQSSCRQMLYNIGRDNANKAYAAYIADVRTKFRQGYVAHCLDVYESFNMRYGSNEDHFTLYYYDQAGNLVRTIPPKGVVPIDNATLLEKIKEERETGVRTVFTAHKMPSTYRFNSLNQLVYQSIPDHDDMAIYGAKEYLNAFDASQRFNDLSFIDNATGYAVSEDRTGGTPKGHIFKSIDGGVSWKEQDGFGLQDINDQFAGITYDEAGAGIVIWIAVGNKGQLIQKSGSDYIIRSLPTSGDLVKTTTMTINGRSQISVFEKNGNIWSSPDALDTWVGPGISLKLKLQGQLKDVYFNGNTGIAICDKGYIYRTTDGGSNWNIVNRNNTKVAYPLRKIIVTGGTNALIFGDNGSVIKADLSAASPAPWEETINNMGGNISDAAYEGPASTVVIQNNKLYYSTNGNKTFTACTLPVITSGPYANIHLQDIIGVSYFNNLYYAITANGVVISINANLVNGTWATTDYIPSISGNVTSFKVTEFIVSTIKRPGFAVGTSTGRGYFKVITVHGAWQTVSPLTGVTQPVMDVSLTSQSSQYYLTARCDGKAVRAASGSGLTFADLSLGTTVSLVDVRPDNTAYVISGSALMYSANQVTTSFGTVFSDVFLVDVKCINEYQSGKLVMADADGEIRMVDLSTATVTNKSYSLNYNHKLNSIAYINSGVSGGKIVIVGEAGMYLLSDINIFNTTPALTWQIYKTGIANNLNKAVDAFIQMTAVGDQGTVLMMPYAHNVPATVEYPPAYATYNFSDMESHTGLPYYLITSSNNKLVRRNYNGTYEDFTLSGLGVKATGIVDFYLYGNNGNIWYYDQVTPVVRQTGFASPVLKAIKMISSSKGFAVGNEGYIWQTQDGGSSWTKVTIAETAYALSNLTGVHFNDDKHGVIIGKHPSNGNAVIFTTDNGGASWTRTQTLAAATFTDVGGINQHMFVTGQSGILYYSNNYGSSWSSISTSVSTHLNTVHVPTPVSAFISGDGGRVFKIDLLQSVIAAVALQPNMSVPLTQRVPNVSIRDIYFKDDITGYVAGASKTLYKTIDGGNSWEQLVYTSATEDAISIEPKDAENMLVSGEGTSSKLYNVNDMKNEYSTRFWYDRLGRLVVSQNSKQFNAYNKRYSYTIYDAKGRIIQSGEIDAPTAIETTYINGRMKDDLYQAWINSTTGKRQVTRSFYDAVQLSAVIPVSYTQNNLRNRVAAVTYQEQFDANILNFQYAQHYNYDIHGMVKDVLIDNRYMKTISGAGTFYDELMFKKISYKYDLLSGKVNYVSFQEGKPDQFFHQYKYDNQNRIAQVLTSTDGRNWEKDAGYEYYLHGVMARTELGADNIQGLDYIYTLQGWLKSMNSSRLDNSKFDLGRDGMISQYHSNFPVDEVGYALGYFSNDYNAVNPAASQADHFITQTSGSDIQPASGLSDLYNGNIGYMITAIRKLGADAPLASTYKYDQLNRLDMATYYNNINLSGNTWNNSSGAAALKDYQNIFSYDANGNILTQQRNGSTASNILMDNLTYVYDQDRNRLKGVNDAVNKFLYAEDVDHQNVSGGGNHRNYVYDAIGNLLKDSVEEIANIEWNVAGKIKKITRVAGSTRPDLQFEYGTDGNRMMKKVIPKKAGQFPTLTLYARDLQGNVMATYTKKYNTDLYLPAIPLNSFSQTLYDLIGPDSFMLFSDYVLSFASPAELQTIGERFSESWGFNIELLRSQIDPAKAIVASGNMSCLSGLDHYTFTEAVGNASDELTRKLFMSLCVCKNSSQTEEFLSMLFANEHFFNAYFQALYDLDPAMVDFMTAEMGLSAGLPLGDMRDLNATDPVFFKDKMRQVINLFNACNLMATAMVNATNSNPDDYMDVLLTDPAKVIDIMVGINCPRAQEAIISMLYQYDPENFPKFLESCVGGYSALYALMLYYDVPGVLRAVIRVLDISEYSAAMSTVYETSYMAAKACDFLPPARCQELLDILRNDYPIYVEKTYVDEHYLYGSTRVGSYQDDALISTVRFTGGYVGGNFNVASIIDASVSPNPSDASGRIENVYRGRKQFEISNHLGNVLATVNDVKDIETTLISGEPFKTAGSVASFASGSGITVTHASGDWARIVFSSSSTTPVSDYALPTLVPSRVYQLFVNITSVSNNRGTMILVNGAEQQTREFYPGKFVITFTANTASPVLRFNNSYGLAGHTVMIDSIGLTQLVNYKANVLNANDYSPFGAPLPDREYHKGQLDKVVVDLKAGAWNLPGWQYTDGTVTGVEAGGKLKMTGTNRYSAMYYEFATVPGRVYRVKYKLTNSTMQFINTSVFSPGLAQALISMAEIYQFTDDRELVFIAKENVSQFFFMKGWSAAATTPSQYAHLDYLHIAEIPDQVHYMSCSEINSLKASLIYAGLDMNDTTLIKGHLNARFNRTFSYLEWDAMMQSCSTGYVARVGKVKVDVWGGDAYRFAYNTQEKDDEILGEGNSYTAEFWQYDARLGRRWNLDPKPNPEISSYATFANNPIMYGDIKGDTLFTRGNVIGTLRGMVDINNRSRVTYGRIPNPQDPNFATYIRVNTDGYVPGTDAGLDLLIRLSGTRVNALFEETNTPRGRITNDNRTVLFPTNAPTPYKLPGGLQLKTLNPKYGILQEPGGRKTIHAKSGDLPESMIRNGVGQTLNIQLSISPQIQFVAGPNVKVPRSLGVFQALNTAYLIATDNDALNSNMGTHLKTTNNVIRSPLYKGERMTGSDGKPLLGSPYKSIMTR